MTNPLGFVLPVAALGFDSLLIKPRRGFFKAGTAVPFVRLPQATIEEVHHDELEITDHPVEQQAAITDHAFKRPAEVIITYGWSDSPTSNSGLSNQATGVAAAVLGSTARTIIGAATTATSYLRGSAGSDSIRNVYFKLLQLQVDRVLFDIYTGKRPYVNMLLKGLSVTTDKRTEHALLLRAHCREVLLVQTTTVSLVPINAKAQVLPEKTTPLVDQGRKQLQQVDVEVKKFIPENITAVPLATP